MIWMDAGIALLLVVAVVFCYRVSKKLQSLRSFTTVLAPSIERLNKTLQNANQSVDVLRQATDISQKGLETYLPNAQAINEDVTLLIEHADRMSYRLDELIVKAEEIEKNLRKTLLVSMKQSEKQMRLNADILSKTQTRQNDPRDLFVQRVISRYPKDPVAASPQDPMRHQG